MRKCPETITDQCVGHDDRNRMPDCLTEALYTSGPDDQTGSVGNGFGVWVGLYVSEKAETIDPADPEGPTVTIPAGTFCLIVETESGRVTRLDYDSAAFAQAAFDLWESQYGNWQMEADMREFAITSSTGRIGR